MFEILLYPHARAIRELEKVAINCLLFCLSPTMTRLYLQDEKTREISNMRRESRGISTFSHIGSEEDLREQRERGSLRQVVLVLMTLICGLRKDSYSFLE